jgi:serine/threonine protein phosphatase PrpC
MIFTTKIFQVPIQEVTGTQIFVLALDGLWDLLSNHSFGKLAACVHQVDKSELSENNDEMNEIDGNIAVALKETAALLMNHCLKKEGTWTMSPSF